MLDILSITGTVFVVMAAGFLAVRVGPFSSAEMQTLGKFVVNFALPALILRAVSTQPISEFANIGYLGAVLTALPLMDESCGIPEVCVF